jgi:CheY-like chemotaxis protein
VIEALDGAEAVEAARRIRRKLPRAPTVAYTATYSYSMTGEALDAGFDECLVKPVTLEDMRGLLERCLPAKKESDDGAATG